MKNKIIYACRWNKNRAKSWSGSAFAVHQELEKVYEVEDFDIKDTVSVKIFKGFRKLKLVKGEASLLSVIKASNKKFQKKYADSKLNVFQFSEAPWTSNTRNFIYQDLAVEYLLYLREHDPVTYAYSDFAKIPKKQLEKRAVVQKEFYKHCECIFTMGEWLADFLRGRYPKNKIKAVGVGINVPALPADYSQKKGNKILFVGRDFERKGGNVVVESFQILRKKYLKDAELFIAGPNENPVNEEIEGITYVGNIDAEELQHYFKICDIFCMPSYFEPYGIVFCEALVNGLPCIARNSFAMKEIITDGQTGYLLENDDAEVLASKMYQLLKNEEIIRNVRANRENYIERYSWKNVVASMIEEIG